MVKITFSIYFLLLSLLLPVQAYGAIGFSCDDIEEAKQKLNVASLNYLNSETTRTPAGSFYKKKIVRGCIKGKCSIISLNRYRSRYIPGHPDSDRNGKVKFPEIDKKQEQKTINKMVKKLAKYARNKICSSKLLVHRTRRDLILIKYASDPMSDKFEFRNNRVVSWTMSSPFGRNTIKFN